MATKKNIYFVQANISCNDVRMYLPYSVGCLIAYAKQFEIINESYCFKNIFFKRETPDDLINKLEEPFFVGFSCNTWNFEYNKKTAKALKQKYPFCKIMFGGHNITEDDTLFEKMPYVDYFIFGEGEEPVCCLLKSFLGQLPVSAVPNLIYRVDGKTIITSAQYDFNIENYPSPYKTGVFERIISENPQIMFNVTMETNRGCPYQCAYCDWSSSSQVRMFSMQRIRDEIDWMAEHKIEYCMPGDANFGILDRDVEIAEYVVAVRKRTGYPKIFKPCYAKIFTENIYKIGILLNTCGADKGVTISSQSFSSDVLKNIGRKNITDDEFMHYLSVFAEKRISTYTELIIGLPGETANSFKNGLCKAIEQGQNNSMTIYSCYVFPGCRMNDAGYRKRFNIQTVHMPINTLHYIPDFNGIDEYYDMVISTDSMCFDDLVDVNIFSAIVQCFHHLGLLRCFAVYCYYEMDIKIYDFYSRLADFIKTYPSMASKFFDDMKKDLLLCENGKWCYRNPEFTDIGWLYEEGAFLEFASRITDFYNQMLPFLKSLKIPDEIFESLLKYQKDIIRLPMEDNYLQITSDWDFYSYFAVPGTVPLQKKQIKLGINLSKTIKNWKDYAVEIVWHGKRHSATVVTNSAEQIIML